MQPTSSIATPTTTARASGRDVTAYATEIAPSFRTLPTRASVLRTTTQRIELDGTWRFRVHRSPSAALRTDRTAPAVVGTDLVDGWTNVEVPGHWPLQGHGRPWYTNTTYPIPADPPWVPSANPTGDHVRDFEWHGGDPGSQ